MGHHHRAAGVQLRRAHQQAHLLTLAALSDSAHAHADQAFVLHHVDAIATVQCRGWKGNDVVDLGALQHRIQKRPCRHRAAVDEAQQHLHATCVSLTRDAFELRQHALATEVGLGAQHLATVQRAAQLLRINGGDAGTQEQRVGRVQREQGLPGLHLIACRNLDLADAGVEGSGDLAALRITARFRQPGLQLRESGRMLGDGLLALAQHELHAGRLLARLVEGAFRTQARILEFFETRDLGLRQGQQRLLLAHGVDIEALADVLALDIGLRLREAWLEVARIEAGKHGAGGHAVSVTRVELQDATAHRCCGAHLVGGLDTPIEDEGGLDGGRLGSQGFDLPYALTSFNG